MRMTETSEAEVYAEVWQTGKRRWEWTIRRPTAWAGRGHARTRHDAITAAQRRMREMAAPEPTRERIYPDRIYPKPGPGVPPHAAPTRLGPSS